MVCDERGRTTKARVWAGGDIMSGGATVISAMGEARIAAMSMDEVLTDGKKRIIPPAPVVDDEDEEDDE